MLSSQLLFSTSPIMAKDAVGYSCCPQHDKSDFELKWRAKLLTKDISYPCWNNTTRQPCSKDNRRLQHQPAHQHRSGDVQASTVAVVAEIYNHPVDSQSGNNANRPPDCTALELTARTRNSPNAFFGSPFSRPRTREQGGGHDGCLLDALPNRVSLLWRQQRNSHNS